MTSAELITGICRLKRELLNFQKMLNHLPSAKQFIISICKGKKNAFISQLRPALSLIYYFKRNAETKAVSYTACSLLSSTEKFMAGKTDEMTSI